jgi:DnaJ family protein C protein 9
MEDLKNAYLETGGSIAEIMTRIPHSTHEDEGRFIVLISDLISKRHLPTLLVWESSVKDEKARLVRKKQGETEAQEAEQLARELGVWDEFYGGGKESERRSKGKGRSRKDEQREDDTSALQALILNKKKNMDSFFDSLAEKYSEPESKSRVRNGKNKKRSKAAEEDDEPEQQSSKKTRGRVPAPPDIDDEEFEKLQQKLFSDKSKTMDAPGPKVVRQKRAKGAR